MIWRQAGQTIAPNQGHKNCRLGKMKLWGAKNERPVWSTQTFVLPQTHPPLFCGPNMWHKTAHAALSLPPQGITSLVWWWKAWP